MKKAALLISSIILYNINVFAQGLELGIGGGISTNNSPSGNMAYKGDQALINYAGTMKLIYTNRANWQFGLDGHVLELASKSTTKYPGYWNDELFIPSVGGDDKKLVYSKFATSLCVIANKKFVFAGSSSVYLGAAFGYSIARNNSKKFESNESYKAPDGGHGFVYGAQIGYTKDFSEKAAFNLEVGVRRYFLSYDAQAPIFTDGRKLDYNIIAVPITIGFRYYIFRVDQSLLAGYDTRRNRYYYYH